MTRAIDSGFRSSTPLAEDKDFESIRNHPRFGRLAELARQHRLLDEYRQLDFWVGSWAVVDAQGQTIGQADVTQDEAGHLITEKWRSRLGQTGTGISYFDPGQQVWRQTWVDSGGDVSTFTGRFARGRMTFTGETVHATGTKVLTRSTLKPIENGHVALVLEHSNDGGKVWQVGFEGVYVPSTNTDGDVEN